MTISIDCPRCRTRLRIPNRLAGSYANCSRCKGRLWVDNNAPTDESEMETVGAPTNGNGASRSAAAPARRAAPPATPPSPKAPAPAISSPPTVASAPTLPASDVPAGRATGPPSAAASPPTRTAAPGKRTARFVTAEATDSTLRLAADGKLPDLQLDEGTAKNNSDTTLRSSNPLVMLGALSISIVLSIALVVIEVGPSTALVTQQKAQMRQLLEDQYFGAGDLENGLEPYQLLLREAQRAYARGDRKTERRSYRKVLYVLRAEGTPELQGVTGSRSWDKTLEEALVVLLSDT